MTRRELLERMGMVAVVSAVPGSVVEGLTVSAQAQPLSAIAGVDRVVMKQRQDLSQRLGRLWRSRPAADAQAARGRRGGAVARAAAPPADPGPAPTTLWSKVSGPGDVTFADPTGRGDDRDVLDARRVRAPGDRRQRHDQGVVDARGEGRTAAAGRRS